MVRRRLLAQLIALALAATPAAAKDEPCTDGVDCWCDIVAGLGYDVRWCEDGENPQLNQNSLPGGVGAGDPTRDGWFIHYPGQADGCSDPTPGTGGDNGIQGDCPTCCVKVVEEDDCGAPGETDCVFQGSHAVGGRYSPGSTSGIYGEKTYTAPSTLGILMMVKFSANFVVGSLPKKTMEFNSPTNHCIFGCTSNTYGIGGSTALPFNGFLYFNSDPGGTASVGNWGGFTGVARGWYPSVPSPYSWIGPGAWDCWRVEITNLGGTSRIRHWIRDVLYVQVDGVSTANLTGGAVFTKAAWNAYANGGYGGPTIAYRYEDNVTLVNGTPPTCSEAGFGSAPPQADPPYAPAFKCASPPCI